MCRSYTQLPSSDLSAQNHDVPLAFIGLVNSRFHVVVYRYREVLELPGGYAIGSLV